ncbi:hypothetical protein PsYK624_165770 [Phanerochaete sordida]|uniref:Uncharacterized protein n=1 Tax=Phanerochaete sordida TaxID=48140 RepID=A0A9P3GR29_9APHY|nr:hypothetical protein PsYK624_165770 [Phanerochaete sordida]
MTLAAPKNSLLSLPNELLLLVYDSFEPWDLLAHVCYHQLHSRTQACYARAYMTDFWQNLLFYNGLVTPFSEMEPTKAFWREAAFGYANHAWTCTHSVCGRQRLEANRAIIREKLETWNPEDWDGTCILDSRAADFRGRIDSNDIFRYIDFNNSFPRHDLDVETLSKLAGKCAFLRADPDVDDGWHTADLLHNHPIILDSFATFPPIDWLRIFHGFLEDEDSVSETTNDYGVTVHDALTLLATHLEKGITPNTIEELVMHGPWDDSENVHDPFPDSWSQSDAVLAAHRVGHWFQVTRWRGFGFHVFDETGYVATVDCEGKWLPEDVQSHIDRYTYPRTS